MKPSEFIHPEDAAALRQLESIPGFPTLVKKFYALGYEKLFYGTDVASNIRLSETKHPELYSHLHAFIPTVTPYADMVTRRQLHPDDKALTTTQAVINEKGGYPYALTFMLIMLYSRFIPLRTWKIQTLRTII